MDHESYLLSADVEVSNLAILRQSLSQKRSVDSLVDVLDVSENEAWFTCGVGLWSSLSLVMITCSLPSRAVSWCLCLSVLGGSRRRSLWLCSRSSSFWLRSRRSRCGNSR